VSIKTPAPRKKRSAKHIKIKKMGVLSKPLLCIIGESRKHYGKDDEIILNDFNTKILDTDRDVHFWCENKWGDIYDPTPINDEELGKNCKDRVYLKWDNQDKEIKRIGKKVWRDCFKLNNLEENEENKMGILMANYMSNSYHQKGGCFINSDIVAYNNKEWHQCVGSFGWKKKVYNHEGNDNMVVDLYWGL